MIRAVSVADLPQLVSIDAALAGRPRRAYFERRLAAAQERPERHLQFAIEDQGAVAGFVLGRVLEGEFGRAEPEARLEVLGVASRAQRRGLGRELASAFEKGASRLGAREIRTMALWREHALLGFLDRSGFSLSPLQILERPTTGDLSPLERDALAARLLQESDLDGVARIDRRHTGRDRADFLRAALREAIADSAVRVSLAALVDGALAGYVMARMDYGDFGRAEPVAVIDTVGVDPLRARQGIGRALLSQLLLNLQGLGVERVETAVASGRLDLAGFFCGAGFSPSERLSFAKRLG